MLSVKKNPFVELISIKNKKQIAKVSESFHKLHLKIHDFFLLYCKFLLFLNVIFSHYFTNSAITFHNVINACAGCPKHN